MGLSAVRAVGVGMCFVFWACGVREKRRNEADGGGKGCRLQQSLHGLDDAVNGRAELLAPPAPRRRSGVADEVPLRAGGNENNVRRAVGVLRTHIPPTTQPPSVCDSQVKHLSGEEGEHNVMLLTSPPARQDQK